MAGPMRVLQRPPVLWSLFVAVHAVLAAGAVLQVNAFGFSDVPHVYQVWFERWASGGPLVGIGAPSVYPVAALVPILVAGLGGPLYVLAWLAAAVAADAVAFAVLAARRSPAALWWLAFLLALGPVALGRIDTFAAALAIVAVGQLARHPRVAGALLAVAAWMKIWPVALIGAAALAGRRRLALLLGAALATAAVVAVDLALGGGPYLLSFLGQQTGRNLQVEAPVSSVWLWLAAAGSPGIRTLFDEGLLDWELRGGGSAVAAAWATPVMAAALLVVAALGALAVVRGADRARALPALALAAVAVLIVLNKVGSPQYLTWLAAPIVLGLLQSGDRYRFPAVLAIGVAVLTQLLYGTAGGALYYLMLAFHPAALLVLSARNLGLAALLVWAVVEVLATIRAARTGAPPGRSPGVATSDRSAGAAPARSSAG